ncbi:FAD-binding oxidoreductase [Saccharopolyspora karakumensis]|uniref:FAD-binding oxidoreductase n=1 Tax=Saccharopolyspora karakumensis TaxID=2530386 RepID=A0A4V2YXS7_9PSEU|nr:FAD-binding oxidoreductase [Saccharopolyspora karakumensis]TDD90537.1 FAD-binding oxidoreductase [Saccharopolyspora karakumensis]
MSLIGNIEVREMVGSITPDELGASFCANDTLINTPTVVNALFEERSRMEPKWWPALRCRLIYSHDTILSVETTDGKFLVDKTVIATGVWTERLIATNRGRHADREERLQVVATAPLPQSIKPVARVRRRPSNTPCSAISPHGTRMPSRPS